MIMNRFNVVMVVTTYYALFLIQVDDTLGLFNELQLQHQAVATKTRTLHDACDRLV